MTRTYDYGQLKHLMIPMETVNLIAKINEYKGKQALYKQQAPQILNVLKDVVIMQSTKASNAIDGIVIEDSRLKYMLESQGDFQNQAEGAFAGYRDVLRMINRSFDVISVGESTVLQLHKELYRYMEVTGGEWRGVDYTAGTGVSEIPFEPVLAVDMPNAMAELCEELRESILKSDVEPLILMSVFILDFLCVHPFNEGNGRMARLLTLLLSYQFGFEVGRYISLEKIIEDSKEAYDDTRKISSIEWHQHTHNIFPWVNYLLGTFLAAYKALENCVGIIVAPKSSKKGRRVQDFVEKQLGYFTKAEIREACPDVSEATINRALNELKEQQVIAPEGLGRSAKWKKL